MNQENSNHQTPNNQTTPPITEVKKSSNSWIYWLIGVCGCILILAIIVPLVLGYGFFNFAKQQAKNFNPENAFNNLEDKLTDKMYDEFEKNINDELEKLGEELENIKDESKENNKPDSKDNQTEETILKVATIEGNLSYPSEVIPNLTVCAEDINNTSNPYCTNSLIDDPKYTAGRGYQLEVAPGDYYVYSYFITPEYVAYYTEFVPCGMDISCPSHDKIVVSVEDGDHATNIDPVDWYMP